MTALVSQSADTMPGFGQKQSFEHVSAPLKNIESPVLSVTYLHVEAGAILPDFHFNAPYRAVLIVEEATSPEWQAAASDWLVKSGCMYTMAWGINCSSWDDSVDWANIEKFAPEDTPDDGFVVTTWHDKETLAEVFWYCQNCAVHPKINLNHTLLVHIAVCERESQIRKQYAAAA